MLPSTRFSLIDVDRTRGRAVLAVDERPTGLAIQGLILEAQFELPDGGALVFVTHDCPFEERLDVHLLRRDGTLEDAVEGSAMYAAGILKIRGVSAAGVDFEFFCNDLVYRLEISARPHLRLPLPYGFRYRRWFSRHRLQVLPGRRPGDG